MSDVTGGVDGAAPDRPFRPKWARIVGITLGIVVPVSVIVTAIIVTTYPGIGSRPFDRVGIILVGLLLGFAAFRQAACAAIPTPDVLIVRNFFSTQRLEWAEILGVRFPEGDPWVQLDLSSGETVAVMGIQRADGRRSIDEARRLKRVVDRHGSASTANGMPPEEG